MRFCPTEIVAPRVVHWIAAAAVARQLIFPIQKLSDVSRTGVVSLQRTATSAARDAPSLVRIIDFATAVLRQATAPERSAAHPAEPSASRNDASLVRPAAFVPVDPTSANPQRASRTVARRAACRFERFPFTSGQRGGTPFGCATISPYST